MEDWEIEKRPDPSALLSNANEERRGKLKLFLGSAPGVGKTFAMLTEAQEKRKENLDVVVGWVDTHQRRETEALLHGLEIIPRLKVEVNGFTYEHLDVKAIIKRRPVTVVIDEMPHANPPGAHHAKRWQDIEEILDVGINVYSALNIQHLESLNGVVSRVTGVQVSETIPDSVFDRADEVRLVDLPPDDLILRLEAGKIYLPSVVGRARNNYFKRSNLIALRDLTLRAMASRIDSEIKSNRLSSSNRSVEDTSFGLLLVLEELGSPDGIREAARVARALASPWHCVWIGEIEKQLSAEAIELLQFAHDLGATTDNLGGNFVSTICDYVRDHNLSLVVFLHNHSLSALWRRHQLAVAAPELKFMTLSHSDRAWSFFDLLRHLFWPHKHHYDAARIGQGAFNSGNVTLALGSSKVATAKIRTERISAQTHAQAEAEVDQMAALHEAEGLLETEPTATVASSDKGSLVGEATAACSLTGSAEAEDVSVAESKAEALKAAQAKEAPAKVAPAKAVSAKAAAKVTKTEPAKATAKSVSEEEVNASRKLAAAVAGAPALSDGATKQSSDSTANSLNNVIESSNWALPLGDDNPYERRSTLKKLRGFFMVIICNLGLTGLLIPLASMLAPTNLVMFYLLITLFSAVRYGYGAAIFSSVVSLLCFDLTMVHPVGSFAIEDLEYLITFIAMLTIGLTAARLVSHRQIMTQEARKRESQTRILYDAARYLSLAIDEDAVYVVISRIFSRGMRINIEFWRYYEDDNEIVRKQVVLKRVDEAIVRWCLERKKPAGMGTHTLNQSSYLYVPIIGSDGPLGVVVLQLHNKGQWTNPSSYRLVQSLITLTAQALDRLESVYEARQTLMNMEAERLRHSLIQSLSHDLRTPLTAILANAENLNSKLKQGQGNTPQAQEDGAALVAATQRMVRLMNNVLEMAKLQTDKLVLNKQWVPAEELIGMARTTLKERLSKFKLKIEIEPNCPPLYGDVVLLDRLLSNLLDNATKYCPEGSTIIIECKRRADKVGLAVIDNGPGIQTDNPQRLFDPFKRGQKESKVVGIGLGLAICKTIARVHDADLFVLPSRLGGACFMLALPYVPLPELDEDDIPMLDDDEELNQAQALATDEAADSASEASAQSRIAQATIKAGPSSKSRERELKEALEAKAQDEAEDEDDEAELDQEQVEAAEAAADAALGADKFIAAEEASAQEIVDKAKAKVRAHIDWRKNSYLREFGIADDPDDYTIKVAVGTKNRGASAKADHNEAAL